MEVVGEYEEEMGISRSSGAIDVFLRRAGSALAG
jgi:hypothetical protein